MKRYLLYFDIAALYPAGGPPVVGVTGLCLADCLEMVRQWYGRKGEAPLVGVAEQPDLTAFEPGVLPLGLGLGVPVWRGIWYPPENLVGAESMETTRRLRERRDP